jgi:hypothetical protein
MTHDELLAKVNEIYVDYLDIPAVNAIKALRKVIIETDRPSISNNVMWTDGWKCAMLTIFLAIEKELR